MDRRPMTSRQGRLGYRLPLPTNASMPVLGATSLRAPERNRAGARRSNETSLRYAVVAVCGGLLLLARPGIASNMGFVWNVTIAAGSGGPTSWLSFPSRYGPANAEQLCQDLGSSVLSIRRWDETGRTFVTYTCGSNSGAFSLSEGASYGVTNKPSATITASIVGSHDDGFTFTLPPTAWSNLSWVSIPYHQSIPTGAGTPGALDAEDLCRSIGSASVWAIVTYDNASGSYVFYACGSVFDTPFAITAGAGYGVVNRAGQTIAWKPPHY
jgi:hypothetical protein